MPNNYRLEKLSSANFVDFIKLYHEVYNIQLDIDKMRIKHATSFAGVGYMGALAYSPENEPAAFFGTFPTLMQVDGKAIIATQSGDVMTHPNHRRKGLFRKLFFKTMDFAKEAGIKFLFAFPNPNSHPGFIKFGSRDLYMMDSFSKRNNISRLDKIKGYFKNLDLEETIDRNNFLFENEPSGRNEIIHSAPFINYKRYNDNKLIQLKNGVVWCKKQYGELIVGMFQFTSETFFSELEDLAKQKNCVFIRFEFSPNYTEYHEILLKRGYKKEKRFPVIFYPLDPSYTNDNIVFSRVDFDTF